MQETILSWSRSRKRMVVMALDAVLALVSMWLAFTLRLDALHWPMGAEWLAYAVAPALALPVFFRLGLYKAIFRYTGVASILATGRAVALYGFALCPLVWLLFHWEGIPRSLIVLQPLLFLILVASSRALGWQWIASRTRLLGTPLLIYGAGIAGAQTAAALSGTHDYALVGFVDDDLQKVGRTINGVKVHAYAETAVVVARYRVTDILLAVPSATRQRRNQIIERLQSLPVRIRSLPGLADLASGRVTVDDFRDLDLDDLLGREPVASRPDFLAGALAGRVVMVTGAGGSIGSELCRQIAREAPSTLLLVDHSEYSLYKIHHELEQWALGGGLGMTLVPVLCSVCNLQRLESICEAHSPQVIYHAAAYKHVPMVESNPGEAVINNVLGTLNLARAALKWGVDSFVLVSTDKAVRPTNVMGATKRIAEQILQSLAACETDPFDERSSSSGKKTRFSMVRFGNVLGSSGSVVPLFRAQIANGGPVTVTDPEVTRYFMTIPEAVQLVLYAGAMARGGDLFVLDMGAPVKIVDLAKRMITLSGRTVRDEFRPTGDIGIAFTGLRAGEKRFEELLIGDNPMPTEHPRIILAREEFVEWPLCSQRVQRLLEAARSGERDAIVDALRTLVPGYMARPAAGRTDTVAQQPEVALARH
ncbi:nucleoside-diphosphate sugar epimerase/dehydratase [Variovorax guangxiensis]|uniref:polysaccharide biosynthesis protein n=1 Tax=Variovorax guangxiensis TaxID=1775474 RepID=UPI002866EEB4|nr:nucleoside-diphosphate sugar epimerase/dehydratase [Variovorax guangxiensis]MDR6854106.1 FlaA1/EpsC-like NDP-sugar epimerase [Variovorax guangxiensis]